MGCKAFVSFLIYSLLTAVFVQFRCFAVFTDYDFAQNKEGTGQPPKSPTSSHSGTHPIEGATFGLDFSLCAREGCDKGSSSTPRPSLCIHAAEDNVTEQSAAGIAMVRMVSAQRPQRRHFLLHLWMGLHGILEPRWRQYLCHPEWKWQSALDRQRVMASPTLAERSTAQQRAPSALSERGQEGWQRVRQGSWQGQREGQRPGQQQSNCSGSCPSSPPPTTHARGTFYAQRLSALHDGQRGQRGSEQARSTTHDVDEYQGSSTSSNYTTSWGALFGLNGDREQGATSCSQGQDRCKARTCKVTLCKRHIPRGVVKVFDTSDRAARKATLRTASGVAPVRGRREQVGRATESCIHGTGTSIFGRCSPSRRHGHRGRGGRGDNHRDGRQNRCECGRGQGHGQGTGGEPITGASAGTSCYRSQGRKPAWSVKNATSWSHRLWRAGCGFLTGVSREAAPWQSSVTSLMGLTELSRPPIAGMEHTAVHSVRKQWHFVSEHLAQFNGLQNQHFVVYDNLQVICPLLHSDPRQPDYHLPGDNDFGRELCHFHCEDLRWDGATDVAPSPCFVEQGLGARPHGQSCSVEPSPGQTRHGTRESSSVAFSLPSSDDVSVAQCLQSVQRPCLVQYLSSRLKPARSRGTSRRVSFDYKVDFWFPSEHQICLPQTGDGRPSLRAPQTPVAAASPTPAPTATAWQVPSHAEELCQFLNCRTACTFEPVCLSASGLFDLELHSAEGVASWVPFEVPLKKGRDWERERVERPPSSPRLRNPGEPDVCKKN